MKRKATPKKTATKSEALTIEVQPALIKGMDAAKITDRQKYINFLIAASLLNYPAIWKSDKTLEKEIQKVKEKMDNENYMR